MFGNAFQFLTSLVLLAALIVTVEPRAGDWAGARLAAWSGVEAPVALPAPAPEPELKPQPVVFRTTSGALSAAEACVAVWSAVDGVGAVSPRGGRPIGGGARAANSAPAENDLYGCVGVSDLAGPVFVVAKATERDVWRRSAWRVDALCDKDGGLIAGGARDLCAWSPL